MPTPRPSPFASLFAARRHTDRLSPVRPHEAVVHHNPEYNGLPRNDADNMHHRDHSQDERIYQNVDLGGNNPIPADGGLQNRHPINLLDFGYESNSNSNNQHHGVNDQVAQPDIPPAEPLRFLYTGSKFYPVFARATDDLHRFPPCDVYPNEDRILETGQTESPRSPSPASSVG
ncbi:uncharacterized protein LOC129586474 [Paramacrobiotus metropolitanus]|uniref:uncharacterized protein LOC129586474 n=1 Tax=Paramacrobiotus metropolitanus TaxID=2943436 RepID=UPI002445AC72|nr:uncharacterized protein LOC129586474 [Paramacrobiotus metropolitanus]